MTSSDLPDLMTPLAPFEHQPRTALVFGVRSVDRTGELARAMGAKKVLLVTDPGIAAAGHAECVQLALQAAGLTVTCFDQVCENPSTQCVEACAAAARDAAVDTIVGLGGGSSMDTAKGCNFLLTNGGRMQDYRGTGKAAKPMLPLIAIPTTAGTGSECQSFALITDERTHQKMACGDPKAAARIAILDPGLTLSQPARVTAFTGIDAISHALETAVTKKRHALSIMYSHAAFRLAITHLPRVLQHPHDLDARGCMLLAAALAGTAIENSMLGAAHAAANPLTAHFGLIHGQAVGMMLPAVIRFNAADPAVKRAYAELASAPEIAGVRDGLDRAVDALVVRLERLLNAAGFPRSLGDLGVPPSAIPDLAREAVQQWTAAFNPRALSAHDFAQLYETAFAPRPEGDIDHIC
jgi:alcohol dehydrogenase